MVTFYKKNDAGEYEDADKDVEQLFRERSDSIIRSKLESSKKNFENEIRGQIEDDVRQSATEKLRNELKDAIEKPFQEKLDASEKKVSELETTLRRKTIAAEYGFKPEVEQFLGEGDDDDMRAKADALKASFGDNSTPKIDKQGEPQVSKLQQKTGITVDIK